MLITRENDYAVRIVRALACGEMRNVEQISTEEKIPMQFAYKILKKLSNAGIVQIIRGASGGYRLIKDVRELTLLDIYHAVDDDMVINECLRPGFTCENDTEDFPCGVRCEMRRIQRALDREFSRHSMAEVLRMRPLRVKKRANPEKKKEE